MFTELKFKSLMTVIAMGMLFGLGCEPIDDDIDDESLESPELFIEHNEVDPSLFLRTLDETADVAEMINNPSINEALINPDNRVIHEVAEMKPLEDDIEKVDPFEDEADEPSTIRIINAADPHLELRLVDGTIKLMRTHALTDAQTNAELSKTRFVPNPIEDEE